MSYIFTDLIQDLRKSNCTTLEAGHLCILLFWKIGRCIDADAVQADVLMDTSCWPTYGSPLAQIYISFTRIQTLW